MVILSSLYILGDEDSYSYLPYGQRDKRLRGDEVTSAVLKSPTKIFAGDGREGEFDYVVVG